ncbi:hypothetical protein B0H14DRAFT_3743198 [Mycena olivaceomarginata]|nr:hypothetical protein B0H14DRAFT_3743198 [Mycena olivaceomarginata]
MASLIFQYVTASMFLSATVRAVTPIVAETTSYGSLADPLNRDSCSSSLWTENVVHLSGLDVLDTPGYSLYRVVSEHAGSLPTAKVEISSFWSGTQIGYGTAASVLHNGFAYLYGATPSRHLAVARAKLTGLFTPSLCIGLVVERRCPPQRGVKTAPASNNTAIALPNTSATQDTVYWSPEVAVVRPGSAGTLFPDANFLISTAPKAEGPWSAPQQFYSGPVGNGSLPAYSAIAHPSLTDGTGDYIFLTYTRTRPAPSGEDLYDTPLIRVDWK